MDAVVKNKVQDLKNTGHIKLAGEQSLSVGEVVFTGVGVAVMLGKMPFVGSFIPERFRFWAGIAIIFVGEWLF